MGKQDDIKSVVSRFYSLIDNYNEGGPDTRYKSWEWCHKAFISKKEEFKGDSPSEDDEIIDYLALQLGFYLASWGMYRGSSYLLQRDYKAHKNAVGIILEEQYEDLWDYMPTEENNEENNIDQVNKLLFGKDNKYIDTNPANNENGLYWRIKFSYLINYDEVNKPEVIDDENELEGSDSDLASDTLATKILMGTIGCIPAFDRYLKNGIGYYKERKGCKGNKALKFNGKNLTRNIEKQNKKEATESFQALANFYIANKGKFPKIQSGVVAYPSMKLVDMFFWEIGYELDIAESLEKENVNGEKKRKLIDYAIGKLKILEAKDKKDSYSDSDYVELAKKIRDKISNEISSV